MNTTDDGTTHARTLLKSQCLSRVSPRSPRFLWPSDDSLLKAQSYLLRDLFVGPETSSSYSKTLLKELLSRIENAVQCAADDDEWETDSNLLELYAELMTTSGSTATGAPSERTIQYIFPRDVVVQTTSTTTLPDPKTWHTITLLESTSLVGAGSTAVKTWEAALRLASHLLHSFAHGDDSLVGSGARVLELGSGTGLLTCFVALLQQQQQQQSGEHTDKGSPCIFSTDLASVVHGKLRQTIELNGLTDSVHLQPLNWLEVDSNTLDSIAPTLILGADIIFDPDMIPALVSTIKCALQYHQHSQALIASTIRNEATYALFLNELQRVGLHSQDFELMRFELRGHPPIVPFNSDHDDLRGGVVNGLRIWSRQGRA